MSQPAMASSLKPRLEALSRIEISVLMDRVLEKARQEQEWGVPDILEAALSLAEADPAMGARLAAFLRERPPTQIRPNIVPKIADQPWAGDVFGVWESGGTKAPVKAAIGARKGK